ncbi:glycoside hydrolase family 5 protein [Lentithecium fluviatile CBS 122367]|uniref:Glycoside hydrolase family 5 protein n=1 Tax=Lentithecium fluviatile CBS 122367 TaxID=1168545 RepID=A0A6G1JIQ3_9PLEO|nr:glycoside hydrolase family 5 protein [Lentithecium fluviatile CBS 122367]
MRPTFVLAAILATAASLMLATSSARTNNSSTTLGYRSVSFEWGKDKVRGVNIGGWLVLEPFITPSIFEAHSTDDWPVIDEWTLCEKLGKEACFNTLKPHWDNFVKLEDFEKIKKAGFNVVRIPVGYWAWYDFGAPYTFGSAPYLDKAVEWARETGLKIIIDLHAAPQSQNGFDHSGKKSPYPGWGQGDSISQTHAVLKIIGERFANRGMQDVVMAIELLNEPFLNAPLDKNMVLQFYRDGFYNLRQISDTPMMMHDGFLNPSWLNTFLSPSDNNAQGVVVDHHEYQIFNAELVAMTVTEHRTLACNAIYSWSTSDKWNIVGEWSGAMTDCAPHLNGFRKGNRYEGSFSGSWWMGSCQGKSGRVKDWSWEWKDDVRRWIETQIEVFEGRTNGWVFWNFKTEGSAGEWDLFQLLDEGVFPQPLTERRFGKYCTNL